MISVQFTIAGAPYENVKVRIEGETANDVLTNASLLSRNSSVLFACYEQFVETRDSGHREAVMTFVDGIPGAVVESEEVASLEPMETPSEDTNLAFWMKDKGSILSTETPEPAPSKKPWERAVSAAPSTPAVDAGQTVNLL